MRVHLAIIAVKEARIELLLPLFRNADAVVLYRYHGLFPLQNYRDAHVSASVCVLQSIGNEV